MIRRALAALLALSLCVATADARLLVITGRDNLGSDVTASGDNYLDTRDHVQGVIESLRSLGVDFDLLSPSNDACKTEFCRTGVFRFLPGQSGEYTKTYTGIVHVGEITALAASGRGYRPDSLTLIGTTTKYVQVPQIFLCTNGTSFSQGSACSTLVSHADNTDQTNIGQTMWIPGTTTTYRQGVAKIFMTVAPVLTWAGGSRIIVRSGGGAGRNSSFSGVPTTWGDSVSFTNNTSTPAEELDSCVVFAKLFTTIPACASGAIIFVQDSDNPRLGRDPALFLTALQFADSLASGTLLDNAKNIPLKLGFQIRGGFSRGTQLSITGSTGGMTTTDSTNFIASIDSIASLRVPFVVGVNIDSIGTYMTTDGRWWDRAPMAHYGVHQTTGITDTAHVATDGGASSYQKPRDIFGVFRNRIAIGPDALTDTGSVRTLVKGAFFKLDSTFGKGRVDHILMPPNSDWSPKNGLTIGRDSLIYAMSLGGARGVAANPYWERLPKVGYGTSQSYNDPILYNKSRGPFKILVTSGVADSGSTVMDIGGGTDPRGAGWRRWPPFTENQWRAALETYPQPMAYAVGDFNVASIGTPDSLRTAQRARIITVYAADLQSGVRDDASYLPLRPAWWPIKNIVNATRVINAYGYKGRKLVVIDYPENLLP